MEIINKAKEARLLAYAPYSNFKVGCAIELKDGSFILGSNVENGSYSLTICAERSAFFTLISKGISPSSIKAIAVIGDTSTPISPCGACRQVWSEFIDDSVVIYLANLKDDIKVTKLSELLPYQFNL
jgi:cytidine deaminase